MDHFLRQRPKAIFEECKRYGRRVLIRAARAAKLGQTAFGSNRDRLSPIFCDPSPPCHGG